MAESEGGGTGLGKKIGPLPAWGWAVLVGGIGGIIWFLRKSQAASAAPPADPNGAGTSGEPYAPTTIVPVNEGLAEEQTKEILAAIKALQGDDSTDDDDDDDGHKPSTQPTHTGPLPAKPPSNKPKPNPVPTKPKPKAPAKPKSVFIKARKGDTYSKIAHEYGHSWQTLWAYQLKPGVRPASTQAELKKRGPNHALFTGSTIAIPSTWKKK